MAGVSSKQRFGFANETTIERVKNCSKNVNMILINSTAFWVNVWKNMVPRAKYRQQN